ncbi:MAG: hypothetical protein SF187_21445 [Deltaproteobacteria bacterium]|nr:hypothetical protein [Deltaproteobacteria bacterium]
MDEALFAIHRRNNEATRNANNTFSAHRRRLTSLLVQTPGGRLAVLGAGNGNDLDWNVLLAAFEEVHVFDIDEEATSYLLDALPKSATPVVAHAPVDLTGTASRYAAWQARRISPEELTLVATDAIEAVASDIGETYDVVVSTCLLSQLMHGARIALGAQHADLRALAVCLQLGHLRLLSRLLNRHGRAILVSDVASNDDLDLRPVVSSETAAQAMAMLTANGRCFTGTDPLQSLRMLETDEVLATQVDAQLPLNAWVWQMSAVRSYLVAALTFARKTLT